MTEQEKLTELDDITKGMKFAKRTVIIGILFMIVAPILFTQKWNWYNLIGSGEVGDAIGGITAPIVNTVGAILVYLALKAQIKANVIIQKQIYRQDEEKRNENLSISIGQLYSNFKNGVDNFRYSTLTKNEFGTGNYVQGAEAFYKMFQDIYCTNHINIDELETNPKITELVSLLEICSSIFDKLANSNIEDKEIHWVLTKQQFENIICPRLKRKDEPGIRQWHCQSCNMNHGLPKELADIIIEIRNKITAHNN